MEWFSPNFEPVRRNGWISVLVVCLHVGAFWWLALAIPSLNSNLISSSVPSLPVRSVGQKEWAAIVLKSADTRHSQIVETTSVDDEKSSDSINPVYLSDRTQRVARPTISKSFGSVESSDTQTVAPDKKKLDLDLDLDLDTSWAFETRKNLGVHDNPNDKSKLSLGTLDRIDNATFGPSTVLNTDEFRYASFFNRLKREVAPRWEPKVRRWSEERQGRLKSGLLLTQTVIQIDSISGRVLRVDIAKSSGFSSLDEAAREAIWMLEKIDNPPAALANGSKVEMQLGFALEVSQSQVQMNYVPDPRFR